MKNWELCPKCNGDGFITQNYSGNSQVCGVCHGGKLINCFTGRPKPLEVVTLSNFDMVEGKLTKIH